MPFGISETAAIIGGGSSILGGIFGSKGAQKAAQQQAQAQQQVVQNTQQTVQQGQAGVGAATTAGQGDIAGGVAAGTGTLGSSIQSILQQYQPYTQAGASATNSLQQLAGPNGPLSQQFSFNPSDLSKDPGYAFTLGQGQQAIQRAAAAQGGLFSTGTLKSLAGYTTGTANQYFNDAYTRSLNTFNTNRQGVLSQIGTLQGLAGQGLSATSGGAGATGALGSQAAGEQYGGAGAIAGLGLQGATTQGQFGMQGAQTIAQALTNQGNAQAAGTVGSTNSWLNALQGGSNALTGYLNGQQLNGSLQNMGAPPPTPWSLIGAGGAPVPPPTVGGV
jgi:hypothetical protein